MKLIIALFLFMALMSISMISYSQCVQCDGNSNPSGYFASVIGMSTTATKDMAFAGGFNSHALGYFSFAFGNQVTADGANSLAFGRYVKALASQAMIFGIGIDTSNFMTNSIPNSLMIGFNSNLATLLVKKANGLGLTGKIGIGNATDPEGNLKAKLHIKGDNNEASLLLIEPNDPINQSALFNIGTASYGLKYAPSRLEFLTGDKFVFYSGNIGIGTYTPTERLEIKGNIKQQSGYRIETERILSTSAKGLQLYNSSNKGIVIDNSGNVGINTSQPTANLQVNGKILTTSLQIPDPAPDDSTKSVEGYVLRSWDAYGNVAWTPQSSLDDGDWTKSGNNVYRATGNVGIGISTPQKKLDVNGDINFTGSLFQNNVPVNFSGYWASNGNNIYYNNGNVGIGISNPSPDYKLSGKQPSSDRVQGFC